MKNNNKYKIHHKRQTLENFKKDIHEFHFEYNGDRIAACVGALTVTFDDDIPEDVQYEVEQKIYEMIDKYETKWSLPKGAEEIAKAYYETGLMW